MSDVNLGQIEALLGNVNRDAVSRALYQQDLSAYYERMAWPILEPGRQYLGNWHIDCIAEHLHAVSLGQIRRLIINMPPRYGKALAHDTPMLTTKGWKQHGELEVGDEVYSPSGRPTKVIATSGEFEGLMDVELSNGDVIACHPNHEWKVWDRFRARWMKLEARHIKEAEHVQYRRFLMPEAWDVPHRPVTEYPTILVSISDLRPGKSKCIQVSEPDGLYCAGRKLNVTHNTNLVSIAWPCWTWTWRPEARWIFVSYSSPLSIEMNVKRRSLLMSEEHKRLFPEILLSEDRNLKEDFANTRTGHMIATSVGGTVTGRGGDFLVLDDPINPEQAHSKAERDSANRFIDQTLSTRLDDKKKGAIVMIQQRLHKEDSTAHLKEHGFVEVARRMDA